MKKMICIKIAYDPNSFKALIPNKIYSVVESLDKYRTNKIDKILK